MFSVVIDGDRKVMARFMTWPEELHGRLLSTITAQAQAIEARVRALAPSRTGRLRSEIRSHIFDQQDRIAGVVSLGPSLPSAEYARAGALEWGGPGRGGAHKVKAYQRTITEAFGRPISPVTIQVKAHLRIARLDAGMFFHGGLDSVAPDAAGQLQAVIDEQARNF